MKRALYSAEKIGHFGLAKAYYAHFTSPIRRYPDLVLHRQLADYLDGKGGRMPQNYLVQTAMLATEREQVADDASRQLIEIKKFRFLQQQLDEKKPIEYRAVVAKCTNYGVFIDIPDLAMGGMVHISNLSKQFVRFNPANETLSAGQTVYRVGTELKVQVATWTSTCGGRISCWSEPIRTAEPSFRARVRRKGSAPAATKRAVRRRKGVRRRAAITGRRTERAPKKRRGRDGSAARNRTAVLIAARTADRCRR
jgi:ribonuclease R